MELPSRHPFPGINGKKCVEDTPPMTKTICINCRRNSRRYSEKKHPRKRPIGTASADVVELKHKVHYQLSEGLNLTLALKQGITDALPIGSVIGVDYDDFNAFHRLVVKAAKNKELAQLFDFVDAADGSTFEAIPSHTARFQTCLAQDEDHPDDSPIDAPESSCLQDLRRSAQASPDSVNKSVSDSG